VLEVLMLSIVRPAHLAFAAVVLGVLAASLAVLATSRTGSRPADRAVLAVTATYVRESLRATPAPPVVEVAGGALPRQAPVPVIGVRNCQALAEAGSYRNDAERVYFLTVCGSASP
jgi:hypothetical protein